MRAKILSDKMSCTFSSTKIKIYFYRNLCYNYFFSKQGFGILEYCVYIIICSNVLLPTFYIGSSSVKAITLQGYRGSPNSKQFKKLWNYHIKNNPNDFVYSILSYHTTRQEALLAEYNIQQHLNVVKLQCFANKSLACIDGFFGMDVSGEKNPMYGKQQSQKTKQIISQKRKSQPKLTCPHCSLKVDAQNAKRWHFDNCLNNPNNSKTKDDRKLSEETKQKMSASSKGYNPSTETRKKLSKLRKGIPAKKLTCPHCGLTGGNSNMTRYHFDNCKNKPDNI